MTSILAPRSAGRAVLLVVAGAALAWITGRDALVQSVGRGQPELALRLDPTNAVALSAQFQQTINQETSDPTRLATWAARARTALRQSPMSAAMIRMVATAPTERQPGQLLRTAERVSRRDALLQLALIEVAVNASRIDGALRHYDHALSIYPDLRPVLFPTLSGAVAEPAIRTSLIRLAREQRPWVPAFLSYSAQTTGQTKALTALLIELDHGAGAVSTARDQEAVLASRLAEHGDYAAARRLAMRAAGSDAAWIDRSGFASANWNTAARPLAWTLAENEGIDAQFDGDHSALITVGSGQAGTALFRVLVPAPGAYRFTVTPALAPEGTAMAAGRWNLVCLRIGARLATPLTDLLMPAGGTTPVSIPVTVAADCAALRVTFAVDNLDGADEAGLVLRDVALVPLR